MVFTDISLTLVFIRLLSKMKFNNESYGALRFGFSSVNVSTMSVAI